MSNLPTITKNLLIINILMFLATTVAERYGINLDNLLGLHFFLSSRFNFAQPLTYMFMHGGWSHIFFNMFALWMFGRILENVWGPKRFLTFYLVCGIGAALIQELVTGIDYLWTSMMLSPELISEVQLHGGEALDQFQNYTNSDMASLNLTLNSSTVGASGAIYGILLGFGMMFPNEPMFIFPLPFPIKTKYMVIGYALIELFSALADNPGDNVAHVAHLGGMFFGLLLIIYWKKQARSNGYYNY